MSRVNFFTRHKPTGFDAHIELDIPEADSGEPTLSRVTKAIKWLADNEFEPDRGPGAAAPDTPTEACDDCGKPMKYIKGKKKDGSAYSGWVCENRTHTAKWDD